MDDGPPPLQELPRSFLRARHQGILAFIDDEDGHETSEEVARKGLVTELALGLSYAVRDGGNRSNQLSPLDKVEHIHPKSRGGTDRVSNLCLACAPCNRREGNRPVEVFLESKPEVLARILKRAKAPLKDATAVNDTRWEMYRRLRATGLPVECGSGGRTKWNVRGFQTGDLVRADVRVYARRIP